MKARWLSGGDERHGQADHPHRPRERGLRVPLGYQSGSGRGPQGQIGCRQGGRGRQICPEAPRARQEPTEGEDSGDMRRRDTVPRALDAGRERPVRRPGAFSRDCHRHRSGARQGVRVRGQRRYCEGRLLLSNDGEEAREGAGDCRGEQPALHLPR